MDSTSGTVQNRALIASILQTGVTEENTPIIIDLLSLEKNEFTDTLIYTLETMDLLTPALKIFILEYKLKAIRKFLNLEIKSYIDEREDLIYIKQPRRQYVKLTEEDALKQVFQSPQIHYPLIGETAELVEQIEFFDEEDYVWKQAIRKFIINDVGRVVKFNSERIINLPNKPAPSLNDNFTYSDLGNDFFKEKIDEKDLLNINV